MSDLFRRLTGQPYVLLSLTSLFWAGNAIVGRHVAGQFPPIMLAFLRWTGAFLIVLPFAWPQLVRDWPAIRARFGLMVALGLASIGCFNTLQYIALESTTALNVLLLQSAMPLFVAIWSLVLLGTRLTLTQGLGILVSMTGVLTILLNGNLFALGDFSLNRGDLVFIAALVIFGFYTAMSSKRPAIDQVSFLTFTFGVGALGQVPFLAWELAAQPPVQLTAGNLASLGYVILFPSIVSYFCYNRGVELIGPNRSAPFFHLVPVFGSVMAITLLGEAAHLYHVVGYALVLAGIVVAARKPKTPMPASERAPT